MLGCETSPEPKPSSIVLPPKPERESIEMPATIADYAKVLAYYESLVERWEAWGEAVEQIVR